MRGHFLTFDLLKNCNLHALLAATMTNILLVLTLCSQRAHSKAHQFIKHRDTTTIVHSIIESHVPNGQHAGVLPREPGQEHVRVVHEGHAGRDRAHHSFPGVAEWAVAGGVAEESDVVAHGYSPVLNTIDSWGGQGVGGKVM